MRNETSFLPSGRYVPQTFEAVTAWCVNHQKSSIAYVYSPLGVVTLVDKKSIEFYACEDCKQSPFEQWLPLVFKLTKSVALKAELFYVVGEFVEFEKLLMTDQKAMKHMLQIAFSVWPEKFEPAQAAARSIAAKMACQEIADEINV